MQGKQSLLWVLLLSSISTNPSLKDQVQYLLQWSSEDKESIKKKSKSHDLRGQLVFDGTPYDDKRKKCTTMPTTFSRNMMKSHFGHVTHVTEEILIMEHSNDIETISGHMLLRTKRR